MGEKIEQLIEKGRLILAEGLIEKNKNSLGEEKVLLLRNLIEKREVPEAKRRFRKPRIVVSTFARGHSGPRPGCR